jgi:hypothetical protein
MFESKQQYIECLSFIVNHEPCMQRSLAVLEDFILSTPPSISITGKEPSMFFNNFFEKHFISIARQVFRYNLLCGFIPWTIITLKTGEKVPKIMPIGSYSWEVRCVDRPKKRQRVPANEHQDAHKTQQNEENTYVEEPVFLKYHVLSILPIGIEPEDIIVSTITEPSMSPAGRGPTQVSSSTRFEAANALFSPLVSVAYSYIRLERALHRRSYADDWNTTARVVTSNNPPRMNTDAPDMDMLDGLAGSGGGAMTSSLGCYTYDNMQLIFSSNDTKVENILTKNKGAQGEHCPIVYTLPQHYRLEKMDTLTPIEDIVQLNGDYQRSVSQITGIPLSIIQNFESNAGLGSGEDPMLMDRIVSQVCKRVSLQIQKVLVEMYMHLYHPNTSHHVTVEDKIAIKFKFTHLVVEEPKTAVAPKRTPKPT